jgi:DNA polymerase III delta subunit
VDELLAPIDAPDPQTTLVLVSAPLDKRTKVFKALAKGATVVECGAPEDVAAAVRWVKTKLEASGVDIDPAGTRAMAVLAGFPERPRNDGKTGNVKRLRGEIDRLLLYTLGQKRITFDDVKEVAGPAALQDDWAMTNAIESGQAGEALRQLGLIFDAGAVPEKVLGQLAWLVRSKFPAIAPGEVTGAVEAVFRTDQDLKRSAGDPRVLLERLIVELCAGKRARAGASRRW